MLLGALGCGVGLAAVLAAGESLAWPAAFSWLGTLAYRAAYTATLPLRPVIFLVFRPDNDHGTLWHSAALGLLLPPLVVAGLLLLRARPGASAGADAARPPDAGPGTTSRTPRPSGAPRGSADLTRRRLLQRAASGAALACAAGAGAYAMVVEPERLAVRRLEIPIRGLPTTLDGLRLVHLSDTHYGPYISLGFLRRVVRRVNALRPDLVALTGDYVHRTAAAIPDGIGVFAGLRARLGAVAVLGNHDHWEGAKRCRQAFAGTRVKLLDNRRLFLTADGLTQRPTPGGEPLCMAGLGDLWEGDPDWRAALGGVAAETPRILLAHNPDLAELLPTGLRVDLMLCGHTHGGQVRLPWLGAPFVPSRHGQRYIGGLCRGPTGPVVVSRGVGLAALPARLGVPPELGLLTLRRA